MDYSALRQRCLSVRDDTITLEDDQFLLGIVSHAAKHIGEITKNNGMVWVKTLGVS